MRFFRNARDNLCLDDEDNHMTRFFVGMGGAYEVGAGVLLFIFPENEVVTVVGYGLMVGGLGLFSVAGFCIQRTTESQCGTFSFN